MSTREAEPQPAAAAEPQAPSPTDESGSALSSAAHTTWDVIRRVHLGTREPSNWVELFKFGVVGASGYVVNLIVFATLVEGLGVHHILGAIGAFAVAVTNNFLWNRHWTFDAAGGHAGRQAWRFFAISILGLAINLVVLALLVDVLEAPELPAQAVAVAVAMPANFIGNKLWTFRWGAR